MRGGPSDRLRRIESPFCPEQVRAFLRVAGMADVRAVYLSKLPGIERKIRVLMDWMIELFFPRDIVQTIDLQQKKP